MRISLFLFLPLFLLVHISCSKSEAETIAPPQQDESTLHVALGRDAYGNKDYDLAEREFKEALSLNKANFATYSDLGKLYYVMATKERNANHKLTRLRQSLDNLDRFLIGADHSSQEYQEIKKLKGRIESEIQKLMPKPADKDIFGRPADTYQKELKKVSGNSLTSFDMPNFSLEGGVVPANTSFRIPSVSYSGGSGANSKGKEPGAVTHTFTNSKTGATVEVSQGQSDALNNARTPQEEMSVLTPSQLEAFNKK